MQFLLRSIMWCIRGLSQNSVDRTHNLDLFTAISLDFYVLFNDPLANKTEKFKSPPLFLYCENK